MHAQLVDIDDPRLVKALAHPIRMKILNILDERTATPKELAEVLGLPLENVSYHVRTLKDFGFIKLERTRQVRGAVEHHYKLAGRPRVGNKLWAQVPRVVQEALTDALRRAPGRLVRVTLRAADDVGEVEVTDEGAARDAPAGTGGFGLVGLRERVRTLGGTLRAEPRLDGGFLVEAVLPA